LVVTVVVDVAVTVVVVVAVVGGAVAVAAATASSGGEFSPECAARLSAIPLGPAALERDVPNDSKAERGGGDEENELAARKACTPPRLEPGGVGTAHGPAGPHGMVATPGWGGALAAVSASTCG
jgi:hypothetical protein